MILIIIHWLKVIADSHLSRRVRWRTKAFLRLSRVVLISVSMQLDLDPAHELLHRWGSRIHSVEVRTWCLRWCPPITVDVLWWVMRCPSAMMINHQLNHQLHLQHPRPSFICAFLNLGIWNHLFRAHLSFGFWLIIIFSSPTRFLKSRKWIVYLNNSEHSFLPFFMFGNFFRITSQNTHFSITAQVWLTWRNMASQ